MFKVASTTAHEPAYGTRGAVGGCHQVPPGRRGRITLDAAAVAVPVPEFDLELRVAGFSALSKIGEHVGSQTRGTAESQCDGCNRDKTKLHGFRLAQWSAGRLHNAHAGNHSAVLPQTGNSLHRSLTTTASLGLGGSSFVHSYVMYEPNVQAAA